MNRKDFSKLQDELDRIGFATNIVRIEKKCFNYVVNFEIIKTFRNRISAKNRVIKLHKKESASPTLF